MVIHSATMIRATTRQQSLAYQFLLYSFLRSFAGSLAGLKLADELRAAYFESILGQDLTFFDHVGAGEVAARCSKDISTIRVGFGERIGYVTSNLAVVIAVSSPYALPRLLQRLLRGNTKQRT
jgi:ATP-binding cassette subfamily B (MDR/TAP) protein 1